MLSIYLRGDISNYNFCCLLSAPAGSLITDYSFVFSKTKLKC